MHNRKSVVCKGQLKTKEVKAMKYETPELTALTAINAIQSNGAKTVCKPIRDSLGQNETKHAYPGWEEGGKAPTERFLRDVAVGHEHTERQDVWHVARAL